MKRIFIIALSFFTLVASMNGCSRENAQGKPHAMKGKKSLEEKVFQKEPNAPSSALNGMDEGKLLEEEHSNASE